MANLKTGNGVAIVKDLPVTLGGLVQRMDSSATPNAPVPVRIITRRDDKTSKHDFVIVNVDAELLTG